MNRRTVLATISTATVATAGCLSDAGDRSNDATTSADGNETDGPGNDSTTTDGTPGSNPDDPFADADCPSFADSTDRTVCWHTTDPDSEPIYLDASTAVFEPTTGDNSVETMAFVLHNESGAPFGLNPHAWAIKRRTDSGWEHVAPDEYVEPWYTVESGQRYTWQLSVEQRTQAMAERTMTVTQDLQDGTYAFQITGLAGEQENDPTRVECLALFEVSRQN